MNVSRIIGYDVPYALLIKGVAVERKLPSHFQVPEEWFPMVLVKGVPLRQFYP